MRHCGGRADAARDGTRRDRNDFGFWTDDRETRLPGGRGDGHGVVHHIAARGGGVRGKAVVTRDD